jgi:hypothetical protein
MTELLALNSLVTLPMLAAMVPQDGIPLSMGAFEPPECESLYNYDGYRLLMDCEVGGRRKKAERDFKNGQLKKVYYKWMLQDVR